MRVYKSGALTGDRVLTGSKALADDFLHAAAIFDNHRARKGP
jgi:hypothetical protein